MRWLLALLLIMIGAVDLGVFIAGPRAENHQVALSYHPAWLPSVLAPLIPGLPDTAPIPLPRGSYSGLGAIPAPFMPLVKHLWVGGHTYMWPMSVQSAAAWARRHVGSVWKPVLHGERVDPGQPTTYEWGFNSRQVPYQTLYTPACDWVVIGRASGSPIKVDALYALITRIARSAGLKPMPGN